MSKRHPKTKEILAEMELWTTVDEWPDDPLKIWHEIEDSLGIDLDCCYKDWGDVLIEGEHVTIGNVLHFVPLGCGLDKNPVYAYCARPGTGKVVKHRIGNCPLRKELE